MNELSCSARSIGTIRGTEHGAALALALAVAGSALLLLLLPPPARADQPPAVDEKVQACLECHEDEGATMTLGDGKEMSVHVDLEAFKKSVHGAELTCTDCHDKYDTAHPEERKFADRRAYVMAGYELCKKCHFDTYTRTLESVHYDLVKQGIRGAPLCTDCHGSHDIANPHAKQAMMARSCARCHDDIYASYAQSVHGRALVESGNTDVPACADCHTHHSIEPPSSVRFKLSSPETCARCHGDAKLMDKYGIPTDVASTYLSDFHGVTASLSKNSPDGQVVVTCVSCHGVHDIASPRRVGAEAMQARVTKSCNECHPDAAPAFPAAWLSHYRPSLGHHPLVFLVDLLYKLFIPFVVCGLLLQVGLHVYRVAVRR